MHIYFPIGTNLSLCLEKLKNRFRSFPSKNSLGQGDAPKCSLVSTVYLPRLVNRVYYSRLGADQSGPDVIPANDHKRCRGSRSKYQRLGRGQAGGLSGHPELTHRLFRTVGPSWRFSLCFGIRYFISFLC